MKLGKGFTVIVNGEIFQSCNIGSISMAHGYFNMIAWHDGEDERVIKCRLKDVEFAGSGIGIDAHVSEMNVEEVVTRNLWHETVSYKEIEAPFKEVGIALVEALKTVTENQQCNIEIKVDGKDFARLFKKNNHTGGD